MALSEGLFPETIKLALAGGRVDAVNLFRFDFNSATMRLWMGGFGLRTNDGATWDNIGSFGDAEGIEQAVNGEAPQATFTLSGLDVTLVRTARDEWREEAKNRLARAYIQFFGTDDPDDPENQRALDLPYPIWAGRMMTPTFDVGAGQDGEPGNSSIKVSAESIFAKRSRPRAALYTDSDQKQRFADDDGFEFVADVVNKVVTWPDN